MNPKRMKIFKDEIQMAEALPGMLSANNAFSAELGRYVREVQPNFREWKKKAEANDWNIDEVAMAAHACLHENIDMRESSRFWFLSGEKKKIMTKNRLKYLYLFFLENHMKGDPFAKNVVEAWVE